jgi:hypothetical protein
MPGLPPSGRKKRGKRPSEREEKLNLIVCMNLICILIPALLSMQVQDFYRHDVELPTRGGSSASAADTGPKRPPFNLKLTINSDNSLMIVNAKVLSPADGLIQQGPGLLLAPLPDGRINARKLQQLLKKEHTQRLNGEPPEAFPDADQITVSAPGDVEFQSIATTLDHVRFEPPASYGNWTGAKDMFGVITLSPGSVGG